MPNTATYTGVVLDSTPVAPDVLGNPGYIDYAVRFTNDANVTDTFDDRVRADGSMLDLQNEMRILLQNKFKPAPEDNVPPSSSFKFAVGDVVTLI